MHITFRQRIILKFRQKLWPGLLVGAALIAIAVASQFEMVRILPPSP